MSVAQHSNGVIMKVTANDSLPQTRSEKTDELQISFDLNVVNLRCDQEESLKCLTLRQGEEKLFDFWIVNLRERSSFKYQFSYKPVN